MALTIGEQALRALQDALGGITGVTGLRVARNRLDAITEYPTILLIDGDDDIDDGTMNIDIHRQAVKIEVCCDGQSRAAADAAADELFGKVVQAIAGAGTLGGVAVECRLLSQSGERDSVAPAGRGGRDRFLTAITVDAQIEFWTRPGNPFVAGP